MIQVCRRDDPIPSVRDLVEHNESVFSLPEIYLRARQVLDDPEAGANELAEVIGTDPGMTARVLRIANSPFFGFVREIATVQQAVGLLGPRQTHDFVLVTAITRAFKGVPEDLVNMDGFWHNSVYCAVLSRLLALHSRCPQPDRVFVAGLLFDIGHLIMYQSLPEHCAAALAEAQRSDRPLAAAETELLGYNYADVGAGLLTFWQLPDSLCAAVAAHPDPANAPSHQLESALVHIASRVCASAGPDVALTEREFTLDPAAATLAKLTDTDCERILVVADKAAAEVLALIFPGQSQAA